MSTLGRTIPALQVRDTAAAFYRDRLGFEVLHHEGRSVEGVDELYAELAQKDVLHPVCRGGVSDTHFGTRELSALDRDGDLVSPFGWETV